MLTQRDKQILKFIESFGGISIYQCSKAYFSDCKHGYDLARKRLKKMYDMGLVKFYTNKLTNERIYCNDTKITPHKTYLLDVYATFLQNNCKILSFDNEPRWMVSKDYPNGKYRSDGLFIIEYNGKKRAYCAEIDVTHTTKMEKYEEIFHSGEWLKKIGGIPAIIVVGDVLTEYHSDNFDSIFLDYKLNGFTEKVLAL